MLLSALGGGCVCPGVDSPPVYIYTFPSPYAGAPLILPLPLLRPRALHDRRPGCVLFYAFFLSFWCVLFHAFLCVAAFFLKMYFCLSVCPAPRIPYHRPFTLTHTIQQTNKQLTKPHLTTIRAARLAQCPAGADLVRVLRPPGRRGGRRGDAAVLLDWGRDWG